MFVQLKYTGMPHYIMQKKKKSMCSLQLDLIHFKKSQFSQENWYIHVNKGPYRTKAATPTTPFLFAAWLLDKIQIIPKKDRNSRWLWCRRRIQIFRMWWVVSPINNKGPLVLLWMFGSSIDEVGSVRGPGSWGAELGTMGCNSRKGFETDREKSI